MRTHSCLIVSVGVPPPHLFFNIYNFLFFIFVSQVNGGENNNIGLCVSSMTE